MVVLFWFFLDVVAELVASFGRFVYVDDEVLRWSAVCRWLPRLLRAVVERLAGSRDLVGFIAKRWPDTGGEYLIGGATLRGMMHGRNGWRPMEKLLLRPAVAWLCV
jgi:hypothetical protein